MATWKVNYFGSPRLTDIRQRNTGGCIQQSGRNTAILNADRGMWVEIVSNETSGAEGNYLYHQQSGDWTCNSEVWCVLKVLCKNDEKWWYMGAEEKSVFTTHDSGSQTNPSTHQIHTASSTCSTKTHQYCRKKMFLLGTVFWEEEKKRGRYICVLQWFLNIFQCNDTGKVYIYGNKALFGVSISK